MGKNLNFTQLMEAVSEESGIPKNTVATVLRVTFDVIGRTVMEGGRIAVTNFGSWYSATVAPRVRRDPSTGEQWRQGKTTYPRFTWSPRVREAVTSGTVLPTLKKRGQNQA